MPQGGGEVSTGHRCPGEKIAVSSLATTIAALCEPGVEILDEGLDFDWTTMPTRPGNGGLVRTPRPVSGQGKARPLSPVMLRTMLDLVAACTTCHRGPTIPIACGS